MCKSISLENKMLPNNIQKNEGNKTAIMGNFYYPEKA